MLQMLMKDLWYLKNRPLRLIYHLSIFPFVCAHLLKCVFWFIYYFIILTARIERWNQIVQNSSKLCFINLYKQSVKCSSLEVDAIFQFESSSMLYLLFKSGNGKLLCFVRIREREYDLKETRKIERWFIFVMTLYKMVRKIAL